MDSHADELCRLLDACEVDAGSVIGTSYGAEVGLLFALRHPDRCRSLVMIDGVSESDAVLKTAVESWKAAALSDARVFYRTLIPWNYSARYITENKQMLAEREDAVAGLPREYFEGFARLCDAFLGLDVTDELSRIKCPTLILVAENDILKTRAYSQRMKDNIPGAELEVIPGAGHAVVIENPEACAERTQAFLDRLDY
ncbi:MAG: alpha/beta hydrolase [Spirochaetaceae bacterium]|nr:MAG: alpha/beta hydrolase [Spirochaetaceae bacterium]